MGNVTKREIIENLRLNCELTKDAAGAVLDEVLLSIMAALDSGDEVHLRGLGRFHVATRAAHTAKNPATGAAVDVPAKRVVRFKASKDLLTATD